MQIAFYGSSLLSSYWNGAATYYRGMLATCTPAATASPSTSRMPSTGRAHRDIEPPDWAACVVYPATGSGVHARHGARRPRPMWCQG